MKIDLTHQIISIISDNRSSTFDINPYKKECLLKGLDDIDYLLSIKDEIVAFENKRE